MERTQSLRLSRRRLTSYRPYAKQRAFHADGPQYRQRALIAANQVGKTLCAAMEVAMHLSGQYPDWWQGLRFDRPVRWLCGSESAELTRKGVQRLLLGTPEVKADWGTGAIPHAALILDMISPRPGVADAVATIGVRHASGGISVCQLASYDQGRTKWQADTVDGVWFDEEPDEDIYNEGLTRTNTTLGPVMLTLTPLKGMSTVVRRLSIEKPPGTHVTVMTLEDAEHYTDAQRKAIIDSYPAHEREARTKGVPTLGSGRIFPLADENISEGAIEIPAHWPRLASMDIGYDHPTACVWQAWDRDADCIHVYDAYRVRQETPVVHAAAIKARGLWIPCAWPHDALQRDKGGSCEQIAKQYRDQGVAMLDTHATFADGGFGVEAGVTEMLDRMKTGRYRVARHLNDWFEEYRLYHRMKGLIVKENDDLMSASRIGVMMLREAKVKPKAKQTVAGMGVPSATGWLGS